MHRLCAREPVEKSAFALFIVYLLIYLLSFLRTRRMGRQCAKYVQQTVLRRWRARAQRTCKIQQISGWSTWLKKRLTIRWVGEQGRASKEGWGQMKSLIDQKDENRRGARWVTRRKFIEGCGRCVCSLYVNITSPMSSIMCSALLRSVSCSTRVTYVRHTCLLRAHYMWTKFSSFLCSGRRIGYRWKRCVTAM